LATGISAGLTPREGRRFGLLIGAVFVALGAISHWRGHAVAPVVLWVIGGALLLGGVLFPGALGPVYRGWMGLARLLSRVTTPLFMGLIYFGLFTPVGFIRRLFGRNALVRPAGATFWVSRDPAAGRRSDLSRQF